MTGQEHVTAENMEKLTRDWRGARTDLAELLYEIVVAAMQGGSFCIWPEPLIPPVRQTLEERGFKVTVVNEGSQMYHAYAKVEW